MEENKIEKQNRTLKIILVVLLIPIISIVSILAYHFLVKPSDADSVAANGKNLPSVNRQDPNSGTAPANTATPPIVNTASPTPTGTPIATPSLPNPVSRSAPFMGKWMMTGGSKTVYFFEEPKKIGSEEIGLMRVTASGGKSYDSKYTNLDRNNSEFEANGSQYTYEVGANGKTLKLEYDGNIMYFERIK